MRALLDANVLIALFDEEHVFNDRAHRWLEQHAAAGIATCPLTENTLVRILCHPNYSSSLRLMPAELIETLESFVAHHDHVFWPDNLTLRSTAAFDRTRILGSKTITDLYLLALATQHDGRLVTFDEHIALSAVPGARPRHLAVI